MDKIEHIGIAVEDLDRSNLLFEKLLGAPAYKIEDVPSEGVRTAFYQVGTDKIELLASLDGSGPIAVFLEKKGEGIHHIAFAVTDLFAEIKRLKAAGFVFLNEIPRPGADNKMVVFMHPKSANGVLVELCQEIAT